MKKLASVLAIGLALTSAAAMASDGTITINGNLTSSTCTINGTAGGNITVTLPTVSTNSLAAAGATAGRTAFNIALTGCTATSAKTFFEAGPNVNAAGRLKNLDLAGAQNVDVQLVSGEGNVIDPNQSAINQASQTIDLSTGSATATYYAEYYATGAATAGAVNSSTTYSMTYN